MIKKTLALILINLLVGCSTSPQKTELIPPPASWGQEQSALSQLNTWSAQGRISAAQAGEGGNASYTWKQEAGFYKIRFMGPFGSGSAELTGNPRQVVLDDADGKTSFAKTPEQIIFKSTGLVIPVQGLSSWIKGIPSPDLKTDSIQFNSDGRLTLLHQAGWTIHYLHFHDIDGLHLPQRIEMSRDDLVIKLIVKKWTL